jgi:hypothetical protein
MQWCVMRSILRKPERKAPQLLMVPYYEDAVDAFLRRCGERVSLELEVTTTYGQPTWTISAYSGPRSSDGLTVNHVIPRTNRPLTREDVMNAAANLGHTSAQVWAQRRRRMQAKAELNNAGKGIGKIVHVK